MNRAVPDEMYQIDFAIHMGESFNVTLALELPPNLPGAISISNYTVKGEIRPQPGSPTLTASFTCEINTDTDTVTVSLPATRTAEITPGRYAYDICMDRMINGQMYRRYLLGGIFDILPSVTV